MKIKEIKHNHSLTDLLKICIFAILLIAPMFASISQMLYVTVNKNAYQSYSDTYITKIDAVNDSSLQMANENYSINLQTFVNYGSSNAYIRLGSGYFNYSNLSESWNHYIKRDVDKLTDVQLENVKGVQIAYGTTLIMRFMDANGTNIKHIQGANNTYFQNLGDTFYFTLTSLGTFDVGSYTTNFNSKSMFLYTKVLDTLDNAFYYGVNKMTESSLFNWTQNTAIYTPINTMTTQLGITTPAIAILITYWFILIVIYIVLDIVLKCFTMISHLIFRSS